MRTVSELLSELKKIEKEEADIHRRRMDILKAIDDADHESWDWVSVIEAAKIIGVSVGFIYTRINSGSLNTKHLGRLVYVKKSEVMAIDDRYVG